jgi:hypothetical protein
MTTVSLETASNKKGQSYFVVKFEKEEDIPEKVQAQYEKIMTTYRFRKTSEMDEVEETGDAKTMDEMGETPW